MRRRPKNSDELLLFPTALSSGPLARMSSRARGESLTPPVQALYQRSKHLVDDFVVAHEPIGACHSLPASFRTVVQCMGHARRQKSPADSTTSPVLAIQRVYRNNTERTQIIRQKTLAGTRSRWVTGLWAQALPLKERIRRGRQYAPFCNSSTCNDLACRIHWECGWRVDSFAALDRGGGPVDRDFQRKEKTSVSSICLRSVRQVI